VVTGFDERATIHDRHRQVKHDHVQALLAHRDQRFETIACSAHPAVCVAKAVRDQGTGASIVVQIGLSRPTGGCG